MFCFWVECNVFLFLVFLIPNFGSLIRLRSHRNHCMCWKQFNCEELFEITRNYFAFCMVVVCNTLCMVLILSISTDRKDLLVFHYCTRSSFLTKRILFSGNFINIYRKEFIFSRWAATNLVCHHNASTLKILLFSYYVELFYFYIWIKVKKRRTGNSYKKMKMKSNRF